MSKNLIEDNSIHSKFWDEIASILSSEIKVVSIKKGKVKTKTYDSTHALALKHPITVFAHKTHVCILYKPYALPKDQAKNFKKVEKKEEKKIEVKEEVKQPIISPISSNTESLFELVNLSLKTNLEFLNNLEAVSCGKKLQKNNPYDKTNRIKDKIEQLKISKIEDPLLTQNIKEISSVLRLDAAATIKAKCKQCGVELDCIALPCGCTVCERDASEYVPSFYLLID